MMFLVRSRTEVKKLVPPLAYGICNNAIEMLVATGSWNNLQCPSPQFLPGDLDLFGVLNRHSIADMLVSLVWVDALNLLHSIADMFVWARIPLKHIAHHAKEYGRDRLWI